MSKMIEIDIDFFEHLLNCMAHQKFIHGVNADAFDMGKEEIEEQQVNDQQVIDEAYHKARKIWKKG